MADRKENNMSEQTRREVIKALARGYSPEKVADLMGVTVDEVKSISQDEIDRGKEFFKKWRG